MSRWYYDRVYKKETGIQEKRKVRTEIVVFLGFGIRFFSIRKIFIHDCHKI